MNKSGEAVKKLVSSFKLQVSGLCVIHDDFDLPLSAFKFEKGRGSAGHKGVQSIINSLDTNVFWRLRIGIRPSGADTTIKAEDYVLKKFSKKEMEIIKKTIQKAIAEHWPF